MKTWGQNKRVNKSRNFAFTVGVKESGRLFGKEWKERRKEKRNLIVTNLKPKIDKIVNFDDQMWQGRHSWKHVKITFWSSVFRIYVNDLSIGQSFVCVCVSSLIGNVFSTFAKIKVFGLGWAHLDMKERKGC